MRRITLCLALLLAGCGGNKTNESVQQAKHLLAVGKPQEALDKLAEDYSAEALFVKSVALNRMDLKDAGAEQIQKAIALNPGEARYRAYQLRLQLQAGNDQAADEILSIYDNHKSSAAIALAAAFAYAQKHKPEEASQTLKASIALSDASPEFLPDMLILALRAQMGPEAQTALAKIEKLGPGDPALARQRIATLMMVNEMDAAVRQARELYIKEDRTEQAARLYARALSSAPATAERDKALEEVLQRYPREDELVVMYVSYLAKSKRLTQAIEYLDKSIEKFPAGSKDLLRNVAVNLPLEMEDADTAEEQLRKYRASIRQPLLLELYDGRILLLRKDYGKALATFAAVMEAGKNDEGGSRALVAEAYKWLRQADYEKRLSDAIQKQADEAKTEAKSDTNQSGETKGAETKSGQKQPAKGKAEPIDEPAQIEDSPRSP